MRVCVEMLMYTIGMDDDGIARLPVVADAIVDFVAFAIENVERRFIHMTVFAVATARLDEMFAKGLRAFLLFNFAPFGHARHRAQAL